MYAVYRWKAERDLGSTIFTTYFPFWRKLSGSPSDDCQVNESHVKARQRGHQNEGLSSHLHYQIHARQELCEEHHCLCHTYGKESLMQSQGQWDFLSVFLVNISFSTPLPPSPPLPPFSSFSSPHPCSLSISLHLLSFFSFQTRSLPLFCVLYQIYEIQLKIIFYICNIST